MRRQLLAWEVDVHPHNESGELLVFATWNMDQNKLERLSGRVLGVFKHVTDLQVKDETLVQEARGVASKIHVAQHKRQADPISWSPDKDLAPNWASHLAVNAKPQSVIYPGGTDRGFVFDLAPANPGDDAHVATYGHIRPLFRESLVLNLGVFYEASTLPLVRVTADPYDPLISQMDPRRPR